MVGSPVNDRGYTSTTSGVSNFQRHALEEQTSYLRGSFFGPSGIHRRFLAVRRGNPIQDGYRALEILSDQLIERMLSANPWRQYSMEDT
jgi:hypothetical protein